MPDPEERVERVLEDSLQRIETPEAAHAVVSRLERLSAGQTEAERDQTAAELTAGADDQPAAAAQAVESAATELQTTTAVQAVSGILDRVAEQSVAPLQAADTVL